MREEEINLETRDGLGLFAQEWVPKNTPRAVVCVFHGLGEHGGQYLEVAKALNTRNISLVAIDQRGHGRSEGKRGHTPSYAALLDDVDALLQGTSERNANVPLFLYGHSLGGNVVLNHALRRRPLVAGVIATSPWLRLTDDLKWYKRMLATAIEPFWPTLSFSTKSDRSPILEEMGLRRNSELFHNLITLRLLMSVRRAGIWATKNAQLLSVPALVIHGLDDPVTDAWASLEFASRVGADCESMLLPGVGHNPHEEDSQIIPSIVAWISARL